MATLTKFDFVPGFHRESTQYAEEGKWYDGNRVRFREGKPENMRGYETRAQGTTFDGSARALLTWLPADNNATAIFGTPDKLYIHEGDELFDITPITTAVALTSCFGTSVGTTRVCCSDTAHGRAVNDYVLFTSTSAIGLSNVSLEGNTYQIVSIINNNAFSINVTANADSTETGVGKATFNYYIATGTSLAAAGLGYSAAAYQASSTPTPGLRAWNQPASLSASGILLDITNWSFDNWGDDVVANRKGGGIFYYDSDASTAGSIDRATSVTTSPVSVNSIIVSPNDRHLICMGANQYEVAATVSGAFNPMLVRWSDQDDRTEWNPRADTTSGEVVLTDGTRIVGAVRSRTAINIWTDNSLWLMTYVGGSFVFNFQQLGTNCGLIGQHAAIDYNGITYWMGHDNFYRNAGAAQVIDCTVRKYIFDDINTTYYDKIYCGINSEFREIIWLYPSTTSTECDKYVIYNPEENYWVYGDSIFTTFEDRTTFTNVITTGVTAAGNNIYNNEPPTVFTGSGEVLPSFIESADFDVQDGNAVMYMNRVIPDFDLSTGQLKMKVITKKYPESTETVEKEFDIFNNTQKVDFRARGRQAKIRVSCGSNNASWRWGSVRIALQGDGER